MVLVKQADRCGGRLVELAGGNGDAVAICAEQRQKLGALGRLVGHRRTEQSLDLLARDPTLDPDLVDALRGLPPDARNGRRLTLIAEMLAAYRVLDARTSGALFELRKLLGPLPSPTGTDRRRRARGR